MDKKQQYSLSKAFSRLFKLLKLENKEITRVYFYAILSGFILLSLPLGIQAIVNLLFGGTISTSLIVLITIVILGTFFNGVLQISQMRITEQIQQRLFARLTFAYAHRIPKLNLLSIDDYYLPELVNRFFDTSTLQKGVAKLLIDFPTASVQILFGLTLLCFYHPIFIVFSLVLTMLVLLIFFYTSKKGFITSMQESDYKYNAAHWLEEISRNVKTFKFYQKHELHLEKTDQLVTGYMNSRDSHFSILVFQYKTLIGFKVLITAIMLIIGSYLFIAQQINLGQFIAAEIVIITILNSVEKMILSLEVVYDVLTSLEKLNKVLDSPSDAEQNTAPSLTIENAQGIEIKTDELSFAYPNKKQVLQHINLTVKAGEKIAITGLEGSGKSTLVRILAGLYPDFSGNILMDNTPLKLINSTSFRQKVSVLLADDEIFSGTILENITLGNNAISLPELQQICTVVGLQDFVNKQQLGLHTHIDTQGKKLSYNISQKILLARCISARPALLLIEDCWIGIEPLIRQQVINYLTHPSNPFTMVAVTNDDYFLSKCSHTYVMKNGSLA